MMPSFHGSARDAGADGFRCLRCHWCDGWVWWPAEHRLTPEGRLHGRVFHDHGICSLKEREARQ